MSLTRVRKQWTLSPQDRPQIDVLARAMGIPRQAAHLLILRGVHTPEEGERFLYPSLDTLSDPFLLTDMDKAVARLQQARERGEHVLVFGDYDVDGIAGTAILLSALRRYGIMQCSYGMPNRVLEGYGLSPDRVQWAKDQGAHLIVTADNGATAMDAAEAAQRLGIDLIITDHHILEAALPPAIAVVNPKREAAEHPAADLCGAGVALKLAIALTGEIHDLDLAALGTIADMVPLRGENRVIAALGLIEARKGQRVGLVKLAQIAKTDLAQLRAGDVAFQIAPRLNAGGRVGNGQSGVDLLTTDSAQEAAAIAEELDAANAERRTIETEMTEEAESLLQANFEERQRSVVLARHGWHPGVIGIVASRLQARYYRPIVLIALDEAGEGRGSARSIDDFDIAAAFEGCREHLVRFGGHRSAAGLTIREENIPAFAAAFETQAATALPAGNLCPRLKIDAQVGLSEVNTELMRTVELLQPFGIGNPEPVFASMNMQLAPNSLREVSGGHLKFAVQEGPSIFPAIAFRTGERAQEIASWPTLDLAFCIQYDRFRGGNTLQLLVRDLCRAGEAFASAPDSASATC